MSGVESASLVDLGKTGSHQQLQLATQRTGTEQAPRALVDLGKTGIQGQSDSTSEQAPRSLVDLGKTGTQTLADSASEQAPHSLVDLGKTGTQTLADSTSEQAPHSLVDLGKTGAEPANESDAETRKAYNLGREQTEPSSADTQPNKTRGENPALDDGQESDAPPRTEETVTEEGTEATDISAAAEAAEEERARDAEDDEARRAEDEQRAEEHQEAREAAKAQQELVHQLSATHRTTASHELAHMMAAGPLMRGGLSLEYQTGPDGRRYAVAGAVQIDTNPAATPLETVRKARAIRNASLAPRSPSAQDVAVAADAVRMMVEAQGDLAADSVKSAKRRS